MPKNKKPAGGSRAQSFEPRYGAKKTSYQDAKRRPGASSAGTSGSKSPKHRGYRPEAEEVPAKKQRWSSQERAGRDEARGIRSHAQGDRPRRDDRPARSFDDRPRRDDRPARSFDDRPRRDDRPARSFDGRPRGERQPRDDRRTFGDARPSFREDRPRREYGDRPARSYDDRPRRE